MKEKLRIILLIIVFIIMLIGVKVLMDYQTNISLQSKSVPISTTENIEIVSNVISNTQKIEEESIVESNVIEVTKDTFEKEVIEESKTVLIDFYADWCGPCKMLSPIVDTVATENPDIKVVRINIDNEENLAIKYGIMSIPTLVVIKNGEEIKRSVGLISQEEVEELVKYRRNND